MLSWNLRFLSESQIKWNDLISHLFHTQNTVSIVHQYTFGRARSHRQLPIWSTNFVMTPFDFAENVQTKMLLILKNVFKKLKRNSNSKKLYLMNPLRTPKKSWIWMSENTVLIIYFFMLNSEKTVPIKCFHQNFVWEYVCYVLKIVFTNHRNVCGSGQVIQSVMGKERGANQIVFQNCWMIWPKRHKRFMNKDQFYHLYLRQ